MNNPVETKIIQTVVPFLFLFFFFFPREEENPSQKSGALHRSQNRRLNLQLAKYPRSARMREEEGEQGVKTEKGEEGRDKFQIRKLMPG